MKSLEICRNLRWKSASRDSDEAAVIMAVFARNQVPYSCLRTCQAWGPDGDAATPELCDRDRDCYAPRRVGHE
ncbi:MAG: hypothetical protein KC468_15135 [Myxococcales bacterium]|nr:hypothetical protein [Myxococcales bacterium]